MWSEAEIRELLSKEEADLVTRHFNFESDGNFIDEATKKRLGTNIPHLTAPLGALTNQWESIRQKMFDTRKARTHPLKDDKILTDWNGLMIAALAKSAQVFNEPLFTAVAVKAVDFILETLQDKNDRLLHRYRNGDAAIHATLNDYVFLIWGLLELYETTFNINHLKNAIKFQDQLIDHFWDSDHGGFYLTADDGEILITRPKEIYDGAIPSGNSVAMLNLLRLGRITANTQYETYAAAISHVFSNTVSKTPIGYTQLLSAVSYGIGPTLEIVIVGDSDTPDTQAMVKAVRAIYFPNKVIILRHPGEDAPIIEFAEFTRHQRAIDEKPTAYVCMNYLCQQPTTDIEQVRSMLRKIQQNSK